MSHHGDPNVETAVRTAGLIAALTYIDNVGFHGIATSLTGTAPRIDRSWPGLIRNSWTAVAAVDCPNELQTLAERFATAAQRLAAALDQRDLSATAEPAQELHVAYHALSDAGWAYLAQTAGIPEEDRTPHHHDHGTPPAAH
ncbi:hypothetical protein [Arthrobacter sp. MW3 TE3886]|uniref:hypothetical protein n=1 Tax=Arthrobacter sp. MW3 TE3886 TaxID=3156254 RepID=UPI0035174BDB